MKTQIERNKEYLNKLKSNGYVRKQFIAPIEVMNKINAYYQDQMAKYKKSLKQCNSVTIQESNSVTENDTCVMNKELPPKIKQHIAGIISNLKSFQISEESKAVIAKKMFHYINGATWEDSTADIQSLTNAFARFSMNVK